MSNTYATQMFSHWDVYALNTKVKVTEDLFYSSKNATEQLNLVILIVSH